MMRLPHPLDHATRMIHGDPFASNSTTRTVQPTVAIRPLGGRRGSICRTTSKRRTGQRQTALSTSHVGDCGPDTGTGNARQVSPAIRRASANSTTETGQQTVRRVHGRRQSLWDLPPRQWYDGCQFGLELDVALRAAPRGPPASARVAHRPLMSSTFALPALRADTPTTIGSITI